MWLLSRTSWFWESLFLETKVIYGNLLSYDYSSCSLHLNWCVFSLNPTSFPFYTFYIAVFSFSIAFCLRLYLLRFDFQKQSVSIKINYIYNPCFTLYPTPSGVTLVSLFPVRLRLYHKWSGAKTGSFSLWSLFITVISNLKYGSTPVLRSFFKQRQRLYRLLTTGV